MFEFVFEIDGKNSILHVTEEFCEMFFEYFGLLGDEVVIDDGEDGIFDHGVEFGRYYSCN